MPWRQLPDGSWLNPETGDLKGLDGRREAAAARISAQQNPRPRPNQFPPLPTQKLVVLPGIKGPQAMIEPRQGNLALNPFELGVGEGAPSPMSDLTKKALVVGGIVGVAWLMTWIGKKKS